MRIVHLISGGHLYGAERVLCDLVTGLLKEGTHHLEIEVGVITATPSNHAPLPLPQRLRKLGIPCTVLRQRHPLDRTVWRDCNSWFSRKRFDIVHTHNYKADVLAAFLPREGRTKRVATVHGYTAMNTKVRWYEALDRFVLKHRFDRVVVVARGMFEHWPSSKRTMIPNAINASLYRRSPEDRDRVRRFWNADEQTLVIGFVGRLSPEKRPDRLIRWLWRRRRQAPNTIVVLAGDGVWRDRIASMVQELDLEDRVRFLGYVADPAAIYAGLDVFVLPSQKEAWPLVLMEAMAAGVACLGPRIGSGPDILDEGRAGLLFDPLKDSSFEEALDRIVCDKDLREDLAVRGRQRVEAAYHPEVMIEAYRHLYEELVS